MKSSALKYVIATLAVTFFVFLNSIFFQTLISIYNPYTPNPLVATAINEILPL
jgi:hypothetical protein